MSVEFHYKAIQVNAILLSFASQVASKLQNGKEYEEPFIAGIL